MNSVATDRVEIRGYAFLGMFRFIKESNFPCGVGGLLQFGSKDLQARFNKKIRKKDWYAYDDFVDLISLMDKTMGKSDPEFLKKLGYQAATADAGTGYKILTMLASPKTIVKVATKQWSKFSNTGTFRIESSSETEFDISLLGFPEIHPGHCEIFEGWLEGMAFACRAKKAKASHPECVNQDDPHCTYNCSFQM